MKHEFTDEQICVAKHSAASHMNRDWIARFNIQDIRAFLDALPDPQPADEWEACSFDEIKKGDRVRMVQAGRTTDFHLPVTEAHSTYLVLQDNTQCSNFHKARYYRIPAPIVHPDPAEHPVILAWLPLWDSPEALMWTGDVYENPAYVFDANEIIDWESATVVPKVVADDDR